MMACLQFCCPCFQWCRKSGSAEETEPLVKRRDSYHKMKVKFQTFRKNVLENSLKDFDVAREDIRDVTLFLPSTGVGNVDAQMSGYVTLYNDHLERWKNLKKLVNDFKKGPVIAGKSRIFTFKGSLVALRKICDDLKGKSFDLNIRSVSEFCLLVDYKPTTPAEDKSQENSAILIYNQISRDLREFIERGPSLAKLLKSIAGGVRFQEDVSPRKEAQKTSAEVEKEVEEEEEEEEEDTSAEIEEENDGQEGKDPDEEAKAKMEKKKKEMKKKQEEETAKSRAEPGIEEEEKEEVESPSAGSRGSRVCVERENLDSSISRAGLTKEREAAVMRSYKNNLEMLGRASTVVEILDLAAKSLWQNIYDEMAEKE